MSKKTKNRRSTSKKGNSHQLKSFFLGDKFKYTIGFFFFLFGLYLLIAFISFLIYGHADHSKLDLTWRQLIGNSDIQVSNKAGKTGAFLSEVIINRGFGLSSFLLIYLLIVTAFQLWNRPFVKFGRAFRFSIVLLFWISIFMGLLLPNIYVNGFLYLGGENGFFVAKWLSSMFGAIGTFFILLCSMFLILLAGSDKFIPKLKKIFGKRQSDSFADEVVTNAKEQGDMVEPDDNLSKVINEEDQIETIFDPDSNELEIDESLDVSGARSHVEEQLAGIGKSNDKDDLEMTVEKIEEEEGEVLDPSEKLEEYDPTLDLSNYKFPSIDLLDDHQSGNVEVSNEELLSNKNKIVETLRHYKIEITKIRATIGPTITLYEIVPAPGVRIAKIKNLEDDIALSLAALGIRIIAPIPGRGTIGIEVPNQHPEVVSMRSIVSSKKFQESTAELPVVLGKTISNETFLIDLVKMPHILVAGATGQGKSVGLNALITSLLYKKHPSQLKLVMIDPKKVELSLYSTIEKHFLAKLPDEEEAIITDIQKAKRYLEFA